MKHHRGSSVPFVVKTSNPQIDSSQAYNFAMNDPNEKTPAPLEELKHNLDEVLELLNQPNIPLTIPPDAQKKPAVEEILPQTVDAGAKS